MKPSEKSEDLLDFLDGITQRAFGRKRSESIEGDVCVICGQTAVDFRDAISKKEFGISGMCQVCQDGFFGQEEGQ